MMEELSQSEILVVDLDNSLVKSDLLIEAILIYIKKNPLNIFNLISWFGGGKANLKHKLSLETLEEIEVETLPYNQSVLEVINLYRDSGKSVILASGTHENVLRKISNWLGVFDDYIGSNSSRNLIGSVKADYLVSNYGEEKFDYIGDSFTDLKVWNFAKNAFIVNPSRRLQKTVEKVATTFTLKQETESSFLVLAKAIRVHQWVKNLLIFLPVMTTLNFGNFEILKNTAVGFVLFCMCASAVYLVNDLFDLSNDRKHETKSLRPIPAGKLNLWIVPIFAISLLFVSVLITLIFFEIGTLFVLLFYIALTSAYTFKLKNILLVDVFVLAILYTVRIVFGVSIVGVPVSFWLLAFSIFLFLSLAIMKRNIELVKKANSFDPENALTSQTLPGRKYAINDLGFLVASGVSTGSAAVVIFALYINDEFVKAKFLHHEFLWLACFLLMFWMYRTWFLAFRGNLNDDPIVFALKDKISLGIGLLMIVLFVLAAG